MMFKIKFWFGIMMQKVFCNHPRIWRYWARKNLTLLNEEIDRLHKRDVEVGRV